MIIRGGGFPNKSALILATSNNDNGFPAITTPDGELKSLIKVVKSTLDFIFFFTDRGHEQQAVPRETDSKQFS